MKPTDEVGYRPRPTIRMATRKRPLADIDIDAGVRGVGVKDAVEVVRAATCDGGESSRTRLSADIRAEDAALLGWLSHATGYNKVTTLVRAIRVLAELVRAEQDGGELTIKYPGGRRERLIIR